MKQKLLGIVELSDPKLFLQRVTENTLSICCRLPEVIMHTSRYGLRLRASTVSGIERWPGPAAHLESTPTEHVGFASPHVGGSLPHIELGDGLSPQAGRKRDEDVDVDASQDGKPCPPPLRPDRYWPRCIQRSLVSPPRRIFQRIHYIHPMATPPPH